MTLSPTELEQPLHGGAHVVVVVDHNHSQIACCVLRHGRKVPSTTMPLASLRGAFSFQDFEIAARKTGFKSARTVAKSTFCKMLNIVQTD